MSDILKLNQCNAYTLQAWKVCSKWHVDLIERATGMTWTTLVPTKKHALKVFEGMTNKEIADWMAEGKIKPQQKWKAGRM